MKPKGLAKTLLGTSALTAAIVVSFIAPSAHAATEDWTGATNGLWGLNTNWSGSTTPDSTYDLTILGPSNVAGALNINIAAAAAANSINFTNTAATTLTNTTSGANQTLTLGSGGLTTGTGAVTIGSATANQNVNIALGASQIWNVGSGGLTATNVISGTGFGLTKTGTGTLILNSANTYTGGTTISAGTLQLNATTGAANAGAFTLASGTTLKINQGGNNFGYGATLNLTGDATINNAGAGAINQTGTVTGNSHALTINSDGNRLYMNGTMSGITQFNVTKGALGFDLSSGNSGGGAAVNVSNGASLWVVNSTVTSTNNITLNGGAGFNSTGALFQENSNNTSTLSGIVTLNSTSSIGVGSATGTILLSGKVTGAGGLTKIGAGTLTLSNSTNNYSGATTVNQGTLNITGNSTGLTGGFVVNANGGNTASTLTLNGNTGSIASNAAIKLNGGVFNYQNTTVGSTFDASGFAFSGGDRTYQSTYGTSGNAVLNLANATRTAGTTNNYTTSGGTNGTTNKITFTSAPTTNALVDKGDYFGGTSYLAYDNAGSYARAYDYSTDANGATSTGGATLGSVTGKNVDLTTAAVTAQTTDSINTLRLGTTNGVAITAANTLSVDGILKSGGNAATISGGSIQAVSSGGEMVIRSNASTDTLTITSVIADNGGSSLTTSGLGTIALNAANTYAGGTKLGAGIVTFNNNTSFGTGTITSNGGALIRNTGGNTTTNNLVVNGLTTLDTTGGNWTLNGNISGSGDIVRGTGATLSLFLGGDNSGYTGTFTQVNNGNAVVRFNAANSGSAGASWVFNNTTAGRTSLDFATGTISFGSMTGAAAINGNNAGTKTISAGALGFNDTYSGVISNGTGTLALTKVGSGTMTLSGANTYTGATTVSAGRLVLSSTGSINSASALTVSNGAAFDVSGKAAYTMGTGGTMIGIGATTAGLFDGSTTTAVTLGNALALNFSTGTLGATSYNLFDYASQTGDFSSISLIGSITGTLTLTSTDTWTGTAGGYDFSFSEATGVLSVVPEPSAALLGGLGLLGLLRRRRVA